MGAKQKRVHLFKSSYNQEISGSVFNKGLRADYRY